MDSQIGQPKLHRDSSARTNAAVVDGGGTVNLVMDSHTGQPKLQRDTSTHTDATVVVGSIVRGDDDDAISTNTVESRTMTWSKKRITR